MSVRDLHTDVEYLEGEISSILLQYYSGGK